MLQILYSIDGARRLPEVELPWLSGYEGSSPVRTGNAASDQLQLDVWGETLDALFLARQAGLPADRDAWALQVALMNYLESGWCQPDNGLWRCAATGDISRTPRSGRGLLLTGWRDRSAGKACPARQRGGSSSAIRSIATW
jgi:GH15 family glucan-1,4-alpha-glucosidase